MSAKLEVKRDMLTKKLTKLYERSDNMMSVLNKQVFSLYQELQKQRWQAEGALEGLSPWKPLSPGYIVYKKKKYGSYPGGANAMMIRTGKLFKYTAEDPRKVVDNKSITISPRTEEIVDEPEYNSSADEQLNLFKRKRRMSKKKREAKSYARWANRERPFMKFGIYQIHQFNTVIRNYLVKGAT